MSTYKVVFSDIDGTLLTSEHIVSTATIEAIASLQDKNIPFVIISSRSASCRETSFPMSDCSMRRRMD